MYDPVDKNGPDYGLDYFSNWIWIFTIFIKRFETKNFNFQFHYHYCQFHCCIHVMINKQLRRLFASKISIENFMYYMTTLEKINIQAWIKSIIFYNFKRVQKTIRPNDKKFVKNPQVSSWSLSMSFCVSSGTEMLTNDEGLS